jgi:hypothetical protein
LRILYDTTWYYMDCTFSQLHTHSLMYMYVCI